MAQHGNEDPTAARGRFLTSLGRLGGGKHASPHAPRELKSSLNDYFPSRRITEHTQRTHVRKRPLQSHRDARAQAWRTWEDNKDVARRELAFPPAGISLQGDCYKLQMTRKSSN